MTKNPENHDQRELGSRNQWKVSGLVAKVAPYTGRPFWTVFAIAVILALNSPALGQECDDVLHHGIYDFNHSTIDSNMTSSYMNWFCSEDFTKDDKADTFKGSIGFPIKGLPVKLGSDFNSQNVSEWQSKLCAGVRSDQTLQLKVQEALETINPRVIDAWKTCVNSQTDGLHVWIERTYDPKLFRIGSKWNPPNPERDPAHVRMSVQANKGVVCSPNPMTVYHQPRGEIRCERRDVIQPVTINISASAGPILGGSALDLAGETADGPVGWSPPHTERNTWAFASEDIRKCGPSDITGIIIDEVPTPPGNDYFFTVQCRPDHSNVQYAIQGDLAKPGDNALEFRKRMETRLGKPVRVTSHPYHSIVQSNDWYTYVYALQ